MQHKRTTFKLYFTEDDIRRVTLDVPDWDHFNEELVALYPAQYHPELKVCYKDEEGDLITISTQKEFELFMQATQDAVKKLYITEGKNSGRYFKDGPPAAPIGLYTVEEGEKKTLEEDENLRKLEFAVPRCLERLIPGGRLTPYNLPSWLQGCVEIKRVPGDDPVVDLDIDVCTLFESLHKQALQLISPESDPQLLKRAKEFLQSMLEIAPRHPLANYNLACVESLLGEAKEAIQSLKRAIEGGYNNLAHMLQDTDLINLRNLPEWQEVVDLLRGGAKEERKEPEPAKEEKKAEPEPVKEPEMVKEEVKEKKAEPEPVKEAVVEVKEEKKEPEEEKKEEVPSRWAAQLEKLNGMGFTNTGVNIVLLDDHKGDLVKVVNALLFGSQ